MNGIERAKEIFNDEIKALELTRDSLGEDFEKLVGLVLERKGKVIITGMGKPGHIGTKIAASLASLGTPSFYMHPGEAMHGDLGMVEKSDLVIILSYSGESDEIRTILPTLKDPYELIFMDAAKGQYLAFLPEILRLLQTGGLLVSDNVLQGGMVLESRYAVERRDRTIHGRMRDYLYTLTHHEELDSVILQGGDGVALSYKKG